jgi:hypothetical protein
MNLEYLQYIIKEKEYGVKKALWAVNEIKKIKTLVKGPSSYDELIHLYERTYLTACLYLAGAKAYFGFRAYVNDPTGKSIRKITIEGLTEMLNVCAEIDAYPFKGPAGQLDWAKDVDRAKELHDHIISGWGDFGYRKFED